MSTLSRLTTLTGCVARVVRVDKRAARAEPRASIEAKGRAPVRVANADRETVARSGDVERQTAGCTAEAALGLAPDSVRLFLLRDHAAWRFCEPGRNAAKPHLKRG